MKTWTERVPFDRNDISTKDVFIGASENLMDSLFFDIETTGFKAEYCSIYMIGCATFEEDAATITLFFAENKYGEKAVLEAFAKLLATKKQCFTFNGNRFDIPFIEKRAQKHQLDITPSSMPCFDLFLFVKQFSNLLQLEHYKQKSLECYLGIQREDLYDGGQLIEVYQRYALHPNAEDLQLLKQHNLDDVRGMLKLLPLLNLGYIYRKNNYTITAVEESDKEILIQGTVEKPLPKPLTLRKDGCYLTYEGDAFRCILYPICGTLRYYYPDYKNYYYLPEEDMIVPKLLGDTIPKDKKQRATKENCCAKKEGRFLRMPTNSLLQSGCSHLFQESYGDKQRYMECSSEGFNNDWLNQYLIDLIKEN